MTAIKVILATFLVFLLLVGGALAFFLLPPHLQIRSIDVEIPNATALADALSQDEDDGPVSIHFVNTATQSGALGTIGHTGFLLEWADGLLFLIDSGMNEAEATQFGKAFEAIGAEPTRTFGPIEAQMGEAIQRIRGIGFTHLHSDHADGIVRICDGQQTPATVFQLPDQFEQHNLHTEAGFDKVMASRCEKRQLGRGAITAVPGFPGLVLIPAGGHTPGSTLFATRVAGETVIFSGDITNTMSDLVNNQPKGFLYSYLLVPEYEKQLAEWRVWLGEQKRNGTTIVVSHDINATGKIALLQAWETQPGG